jgi:phosphomannomutase
MGAPHMAGQPTELADDVSAWIADDSHPGDAAELQALVDGGEWDELADRFRAPLTFGTAGLRGPLRAGPNGMNATVVRRAAAGIATWLARSGRGGGLVVIGYDGRFRSAEFATDSAAVFAAAGFDTRVMPRLLPTPVLAFAVQYFGAVAGIMVTASHNPPQDNGYKVYLGDGAQLAPPTDTYIEAAIRAVGPARAIPTSASYTTLNDTVVDAYVAAVTALVGPPRTGLRIVHTAMHGVGTEIVARAFAKAGFEPLISVSRQAAPDPRFPTVAFPNPEEPGALDLALALARERDADLVIANDPDADRCAVAVPDRGNWRMLRGDEVGVLLADALLGRGVRGTYATTIVSSTMLRALAERHGVGYAETLTGFKWIMRAAPDMVYGYEEALGYAVAPNLVRDKDGISAALLVAERAAALKSADSSLVGRLDDLAAEYGRYQTDQISVRVDELAMIDQIMARLRADPPDQLLGRPVEVADLLPDTDALRWTFPGGRVVLRPSGTEPKLKAYLQVVVPDGSRATAEARMAELRSEVADRLGQPSE